MRWAEITEENDPITEIISKTAQHFGANKLYGGNCGTFALALGKFLEANHKVTVLIICKDLYEELDDVEVSDLIASEPSIYHVALNVDGSIYDGDGKVTLDHIADWIESEYSDYDAITLNYPLSDTKLPVLINNDTNWSISSSDFLKVISSF